MENIFLYINYYLPGVFEKNRVANAVNGSLWSLPAEFFMYCIVAVVGLVSSKRWIYLLLFVIFALINYHWAHRVQEMLVIYRTDTRQIFMCGIYFLAGILYYKYNLKKYFTLSNTIAACVAMLCLESNTESLIIFSYILLPFIVLAFGLSDSPILNRLLGKNDISYGIYIYAFPIQQAIVYLFPSVKITPYIIICTIITLPLALLSWHLIESKALNFKPSADRSI